MAKFTINLKNSSIDLPDDVGTYVVSTGCGSGKTHWLKGFVRQYYNDGILVVVDSIRSANTLYDSLLGLGMSEDDMLMIHSKTDFAVQNEFSRNPNEVTKKKVLIMTNVRLYTEFPPVYMLYNSRGIQLGYFNGDWTGLMNDPNVRRWIIIDEIPGFIQDFCKVSKLHLGVLSEPDGHGGYKAKDEPEMLNAYRSFISNSGSPFFDGSTELGKLKIETTLAFIRKDYQNMIKAKEASYIQFSPCDFQSNRSLVLIMEGAGDILFKDSAVYNLVDVRQKYTSPAVFSKFNIPDLKRKDTSTNMTVQRMVEQVESIITKTKGKHLIVCWKDFSGNEATGDDNTDSSLVMLLKERLDALKIPDDSYSIIYYGSSESRAVNTFKDYKNIILLGKWSLPVSSSSEKFNMVFQTKTTLTRYMLWEYVQLITRTRIRLGMDINVFYSDDHDSDFMATLEKYLNQNKLDIKEEHVDWRDKVKKEKYGGRQLCNIEKLTLRFPFLPEQIIEPQKEKKINISVPELNDLLGYKDRRRKHYEPLQRVLEKFNVKLEIIT